MINSERYHRQILLKEFGEEAQKKLLAAKVLVIGAGGLGCPALLYLAAAGVGTIGIVDFDVVDVANLHRQIIYCVSDIGKQKVDVSAKRLNDLNPEIETIKFNVNLRADNAFEIISKFDLVIDGSDNFPTRYLVNDVCLILDKPLVYGSVLRFEGQVGVFNLKDEETNVKANYRDLFPEPPEAGSTFSCNEAGVLGVLPGIIGTMQATEAIKIIAGIGKPLCNRIISYNALSNLFYEFEITSSNFWASSTPKAESEVLGYNYELFCNILKKKNQISIEEFESRRNIEKLNIIDVRELNEIPAVNEFNYTCIPMSEFKSKITSIDILETIVIFCKSGNRSDKAVNILKEVFPECKAYSLTGGIEAWKNHHQFN